MARSLLKQATSLVITLGLLLPLMVVQAKKPWWEYSNIYQVYPRSFMDTNGDGVGDLNGVTERLRYLKDIGMDCVWLSPIFKSPMADFGYDISDYYQVQPEYGSNDDLRNLIAEAHYLGIKLLLDFVPNHTSDEHEWFIRAVNGDPDYRDFYVWHDGVINPTTGEREPPSNWISQFRYSAWEWNEQRQQYYLHQFGVKQPDLNYRNPAVVQALKDVLTYWLEQGIDGFRIDAVPFLFENEIDPSTGTYPDEPVIADTTQCPDPADYCYLQHPYTNSLPESTEMVYQWRELLEQFKSEHNSDTKILLTEAYTNFDNLMLMYGNGKRNGSHVPFNFEMLSLLNNGSNAAEYYRLVEHWLENMPRGVSANWVLGNHDNRRLASRFGVQRTDLMNIFLQTLPGIAITYNGEEYGMEDVHVSWEDTVDPQGCSADPNTYDKYSRDPARTPFRWDNSANAGFSKASHTWLPVGPGYESENVAAQLAAPNSHLKIFKRIVHLRKVEPAFQEGYFLPRVVDDILMFKRQAASGYGFIVVLNIGGTQKELDLTTYFGGVDSNVKVAVASLQSRYSSNEIVNSRSFVAEPYVGTILRLINDFE